MRPKAILFKEAVFKRTYLTTLQDLEKLQLADPDAWEAMKNRHDANKYVFVLHFYPIIDHFRLQAAPAASQWMNTAGDFVDDQQGDQMEM